MNRLFILIFILALGSCSHERNQTKDQVMAFYKGFMSSDYHQIRNLISDSLTMTEGDYIMNFTPESFHEHFKWDSIFKPTYRLVGLENQDKKIVATVAVTSLRLEFLKNNPLTCRQQFSFEKGKITKIENLDCTDANWKLWQAKRDSLVNWVKVNHPELDGFINDLSMQGAIDYVNAIALYRKHRHN